MNVDRAVVVGAGEGISGAVARQLAARGAKVLLANRSPEKVEDLADEIDAITVACDATDRAAVDRLFETVDHQLGGVDFVLYNPSFRTRGPFLELDPDDVARALMVSAYGGFLVAQPAASRMVAQGHGAIFFTGASASVKGYARSAPFAMGKFALRGLAQSMARELGPQNVHVAHFVIDGSVRSSRRPEPADQPDSMLDPEAIAKTYMAVLDQPRSAWSLEVELRPWVEPF